LYHSYFNGNNVHVQGRVSVNDVEIFLNTLTKANAKQVSSRSHQLYIFFLSAIKKIVMGGGIGRKT